MAHCRFGICRNSHDVFRNRHWHGGWAFAVGRHDFLLSSSCPRPNAYDDSIRRRYEPHVHDVAVCKKELAISLHYRINHWRVCGGANIHDTSI